MADRIFRPYTARDKEACLAVFDSNVPKYFAAHERAGYANFLDAQPGPYFVVDEDDAVVACGGSVPHKTEIGAVLFCWGMVAKDKLRNGVGHFLLSENLKRLKKSEPVLLNTSQHAREFYEKHGFKTSRVVRDGYGAGIDLHEMRLAPHSGR